MMNYLAVLEGPNGRCPFVRVSVERALTLTRALEMTSEPEARRVLFIQLGEVERLLRHAYVSDDATNDVRHVPIVVQVSRDEPTRASEETTHEASCWAPTDESERRAVAQPQNSDESDPMNLQTKTCPNCGTAHSQQTCPGSLPNGDPCGLPHPDARS